MEKWLIYSKKDDFDEIGKRFGISPVVSRIIRNRDIVGDKAIDSYLNGTVEDMYSPWQLKDMDKAVKILNNKIKEAKKIRVMSDYDIDGICSAYVLVTGLDKLNALVDMKIPNRITDGYGMNVSMVEQAHLDGIDTIITCDNGIAAIEAIARAKELGMSVIVTDHHEVPFNNTWRGKEYIYSDADAIIDPKQENCGYPFKDLCGAGVAYKLLEAVYLHFGRTTKDVLKYLEYVAIATIGDIVSLTDENRIITKYGLLLLNRTTNVGLSQLIDVNGLYDQVITSYHVGFVIGPCLNAAGRLEEAQMAFDLLRETDKDKAKQMAKELTRLNAERKKLTDEGVKQAKQDMESFSNLPVVVIYLPDCHESVAGIVAGRIRDLCYKPVIVITPTEGGVKGSGRSIEGYNMFEELSKCKSILTKFGGHAMAAGLSLEEENIDVLRNMLNSYINVDENIFVKKMWIDVALPLEYVSMTFTDELTILEPHGKGNEKPSFGEKNISVLKLRILGQNQNVIKMDLANENDCRVSGLYFDNNHDFMDYLKEIYGENEVNKAILGRPNCIRLSIIYSPTINEYMGRKSVELRIKSYK